MQEFAGITSTEPQSSSTPRICFLLACHNRRQATLDCIESIVKQDIYRLVDATIIMVDDGSTDGTTEAVREYFPQVHIIAGNGSLYWNGAMRLAMAHALQEEFDYYLFINDDTRLFPHALRVLFSTHNYLIARGFSASIVVGSTRGHNLRVVTYGGLKQKNRLVPLWLEKVTPGDIPIRCETFNGNCVLIPRVVTELVGNLDKAYTHAMGDFDYGFRAIQHGCTIWVAPSFVGQCDLNKDKELWYDHAVSVRTRWKRLTGPKGLPPKEWLVFTRRHSGPLWPIFWINPYVRFWLKAIQAALELKTQSGLP